MLSDVNAYRSTGQACRQLRKLPINRLRLISAFDTCDYILRDRCGVQRLLLNACSNKLGNSFLSGIMAQSGFVVLSTPRSSAYYAGSKHTGGYQVHAGFQAAYAFCNALRQAAEPFYQTIEKSGYCGRSIRVAAGILHKLCNTLVLLALDIISGKLSSCDNSIIKLAVSL